MIDPVQLKATMLSIVDELNSAADFVGIVDPALIPFIIIGKAVDKQIPGLVATATNWIQGGAPTQSDLDEKVQQLAVLGDPNGI